jgi:hypothetical protein
VKNAIKTTIFILLISIVCSCFTGCGPTQQEMDEYYNERFAEYIYRHEIVQITNTKDINGNFFLGCGNIGDVAYYYLYIKDRNSVRLLRLEALSTDQYSISIYQDSESPYITSSFVGENDSPYRSDHKQTIEIHIPKESMVQNIDINTSNYK